MEPVAALNTYLEEVLLFTDPVVLVALNAQGLTSIDELCSLTEKDIVNICANARKPGGTIPNPVFDQNEDEGIIVPERIANPGVLVGHLHEKRLKMLRYYRWHLQRIQRDFVPDEATLERLVDVYELKELEDDDAEEEVKMPPKLTSIDKVRECAENIDDYLERVLGSYKSPLKGVVRDVVALPVGDEDPGFGLPTYRAEMIRRVPHTGSHFQKDNLAVWVLLRHVTHGGPGYGWIKQFERTKDGRSAYLAFKRHYLGDSYGKRLRATADHTLNVTYFDGKSRSFTYERYVETLKSAFSDLEASGETVDEGRKVRIFLQGLVDSRLQVAKSQVLATASLGDTYDNAVNFISQFLDERRSYAGTERGPQQRNVSSMTTGRGGQITGRGRGGRDNRGGRSGGRGYGRGNNHNNNNNRNNDVTDRYYTPEEWRTLNPEQQQRVRDMRANRDRRRGVEAVNTTRNTRQRTDGHEASQAQATPTASVNTQSSLQGQQSTGIGATMSQRRPTPSRSNNV
jgi:hypothetical protein